MIVIPDVREMTRHFPRLALTAGIFDGVHLGHRRVLERVIACARERDGAAGLLTMDPHPREVFSPDHAPNLLTTKTKKLRLLEEIGLDAVFILPFNREVARLDRREFVAEILVNRLRVEALIVGHDFCFGRNALGDYAFLCEVAPEFGFTIEQAPAVLLDGERISSTLIRERILQGDLDHAERLLGRKYSLSGVVKGGRGVGEQLGFPTANVQPHHSAVPAQGVYAARARLDGGTFAAAVNIGIAPTIRHEDLTVEAHLLDFAGDLLGQEIEIEFHKRLRSERKFPSREALAEQIRRDVADVRAHFGGV